MNEEDLKFLSDRAKTIKMSGKKCNFGSSSVFNCHCNICRDNIVEYLGKKKGLKYLYTGKFAPEYMRNKEIEIIHFSTTEEDETSSCEAFIKLCDGSEGQCEWIPREEIKNKLN